jgi:peptide/nickel transport system substrate-binding protein
MGKRTGIARSRAGVMALVMTSVLAAAACQSAVEQAERGAAGNEEASCQPGGTVVAANVSAPALDRVLTQNAANTHWVRGVFEPLINVTTQDVDNPQPLLATAWEFTDDDLTAVLQLGEGVKFHSGRPFTADDVLFSIQQALDPATPSDVKSILEGWQVEATGEHEITIRSQTPLSPVLGSTLALTPIVDRETYAGLASGESIVGTGPFRVESYTPGSDMVLTRYEDYWQEDRPYLDRIEAVTIGDSTAQVSALRSGRTQFSTGLTIQDAIATTTGSNQLELLDTIYGVYPIILDAVPDQAVRQAIGYAIDKERINEQVFGGLGSVTGLYWAEGAEGYPADLANPYPYDPDRARQLIEQAGAAGTEVSITTLNIPVLQAEYEIIANNLTEVGLRPTVTALAPADYQQRLTAGQGGNYLSLRGINGGASFMLQTNADLRLEGAHRQFSPPEYEQLVQQVIQAGRGEEGAKALRELTEYMNEQAFLHPLVTTFGQAVKSAELQNVDVAVGGWIPANSCLVLQ